MAATFNGGDREKVRAGLTAVVCYAAEYAVAPRRSGEKALSNLDETSKCGMYHMILIVRCKTAVVLDERVWSS